MKIITIEEDRQFVMAQRDDMKGYIAGKDKIFEFSQVKKRKRIGQKEKRRRNELARKEGDSANNMQSCCLDFSASHSESNDHMQDSTFEPQFKMPSKLSKRSTKESTSNIATI